MRSIEIILCKHEAMILVSRGMVARPGYLHAESKSRLMSMRDSVFVQCQQQMNEISDYQGFFTTDSEYKGTIKPARQNT